MALKVILAIAMVSGLLLTSCYPELSVQQYDKLRKDIAELDVRRQALEKELTDIKATHSKTRAYVELLNKMVSTQSSEKLLAGQFDVPSLINAKSELLKLANNLQDNEIAYFLGLMKADNQSQTMAAYYKVIEYFLKKITQNLE